MVLAQPKKSNHQVVSKGVLNYTLTKYVISSGGGVMTGNSGTYKVTGVIGQIDAGHNATQSPYVFKGGFLHGTSSTNSGDAIFSNGFE